MTIMWNQDKIKESAKDFNNYQGKAVIMVDVSDGSVWTDIFVGNDWKEYHSDTIFSLYGKDDFRGRNGKISAKAINALLDANAYKYDDISDCPMEVLKVYNQYKL